MVLKLTAFPLFQSGVPSLWNPLKPSLPILSTDEAYTLEPFFEGPFNSIHLSSEISSGTIADNFSLSSSDKSCVLSGVDGATYLLLTVILSLMSSPCGFFNTFPSLSNAVTVTVYVSPTVSVVIAE